MTPKQSTNASQPDEDEWTFTSTLYKDSSVESALPKDIVDALGLSAEYAAIIHPMWMDDTLSIGFEVTFDESAGAGISGRQLHEVGSNDSLSIRFPALLGWLTGLDRLQDETETVQLQYQVFKDGTLVDIESEENLNPEDVTLVLTTLPRLTPPGGSIGGQPNHPKLDEAFKDSGFAPSRSRDSGIIESIRYEVPVEYARAYGFEPRQRVTLELVSVDGTFGIAINLDGDPDDPLTVDRALNAYEPGSSGPREDLYAISIPKVAVHALRWSLDMPIRAIPQADRFVIVPDQPISSFDSVEEEILSEDAAGESASV